MTKAQVLIRYLEHLRGPVLVDVCDSCHHWGYVDTCGLGYHLGPCGCPRAMQPQWVWQSDWPAQPPRAMGTTWPLLRTIFGSYFYRGQGWCWCPWPMLSPWSPGFSGVWATTWYHFGVWCLCCYWCQTDLGNQDCQLGLWYPLDQDYGCGPCHIKSLCWCLRILRLWKTMLMLGGLGCHVGPWPLLADGHWDHVVLSCPHLLLALERLVLSLKGEFAPNSGKMVPPLTVGMNLS